MNYNYIVNPLTNRKCSIHSRNGKKILNQYLIQNIVVFINCFKIYIYNWDLYQ